jgi:hypothetical protein
LLPFLNVSAQPLPSYVPTSGILGWYPFNGDSDDESGGGNDMVLYGGPTLSADRFGTALSCYYMDGMNDYMVTQNKNFDASTNHSISIWFRLDDAARRWQTIYNTDIHRIECVTYNWFLTQGFDIALGDGADWTITDDTYNNLDTFNLPLKKTSWNHLVTVKDGLTWYFYLNGRLEYTNLVTGDPSNTLSSLRFGAIDYMGPYEQLKGYLDDIGVWNRALTGKEVETLYLGKTASITDKSNANNEMSIYPTLAQTTLFVQGKVSEIVIYNLSGQRLKQQSGMRNSINQIDITDLSTGYYIANLKAEDGSSIRKQFIKQ